MIRISMAVLLCIGQTLVITVSHKHTLIPKYISSNNIVVHLSSVYYTRL